jgi:hypothetical protein
MYVCCITPTCTHSQNEQHRALEQACKSDALLEAFSSQLIAELQQPGNVCGKGWLHGDADKIEKLVKLSLSKVDLSNADTHNNNNADAQCEASWQGLMQLAEMSNDHPLVWWAAAQVLWIIESLKPFS